MTCTGVLTPFSAIRPRAVRAVTPRAKMGKSRPAASSTSRTRPSATTPVTPPVLAASVSRPPQQPASMGARCWMTMTPSAPQASIAAQPRCRTGPGAGGPTSSSMVVARPAIAPEPERRGRPETTPSRPSWSSASETVQQSRRRRRLTRSSVMDRGPPSMAGAGGVIPAVIRL